MLSSFGLGETPSTLVFSDWSVLVFRVQLSSICHVASLSFLPQKHSFCAGIMAVLAVSTLEFGRLWGYFVIYLCFKCWLWGFGFAIWFLRVPLVVGNGRAAPSSWEVF